MITTKNNFMTYVRKKYPDVEVMTIRGLPVCLLSKPLSELDDFYYNVTPMANGRYIAFIGVTASEIPHLLDKASREDIVLNKTRQEAPTTFGSFHYWLERKGIQPINRTRCNDSCPAELLQDNELSFAKDTYYLYELPYGDDEYINSDNVDLLLANIPHRVIESVVIVVIKASGNNYKSKKAQFLKKYQMMLPLNEQIASACSVQDWDKAQALCIQYMTILFERNGTVNIEKMKTAYSNNQIHLFIRDPANLEPIVVNTEEEDF